MKRVAWLAAGAVISLLPPRAASAAAPLDAYGRLPALDQMTISPDGATLAYVASSAAGRRVVIQRLSDDKILATLQAGENKVRWLDWAGARHLLVTLSKTALLEDPTGYVQFLGGISEYFSVQDYNLDSNRTLAPMDSAPQALNVVSSRPVVRTSSGRPTVFLEGVSYATADSGKPLATLYSTSLDGRPLAKVDTGPRSTEGWVIDPQGRAVAQAQYDSKSGRYSVLLREQGRWVERYAESAPLDPPSLMGLASRPGVMLVRAYRKGRPALYEMSLNAGAWSAPLDIPADDYLLHDPLSRLAIGRVHTGESRIEYIFDDPADQRAWNKLAKAFEGEEVTLASWSDDRKRIIVKVEGGRDGAAYALVNLNTGKVDWLGDAHEGVTDKDVAEVRTISYTAADGLRIPAYLTLPRGREAKRLPLVVLPHGGPASRDLPGFDWWAQALASRGYAVLQPQFRGSDGFGETHLAAGYGQWGRKMQTDLSDGVRHLAKEGLIDPKRVCIVGASYGGYAALAGATLDAGAYRCAVSVAGPADLGRMIGHARGRWGGRSNIATRYWARFMGVEDGSESKLDSLSPARLADRVNIPVLLIHGQDDTVVPYQQSLTMQRALQSAGKSAELVTLKGEDHWLSQGATRLQMLRATVQFLETNNPPG